MKKISASTFYGKKVFPSVWFGALALMALSSLRFGVKSHGFPLIFLLAMAVFSFFLFKNTVWDLADEVIDEGEALLFRKGGKEQKVYLRDVVNISHGMGSSGRVDVRVKTEGPLGKELAFNSPVRLNPFAKNRIAIELIERVEQARNR